MRRQSNPITPHETWLELFWSKFDFVLSLVFKYKASVGVLSSSIWVLYKGRIFLATTDRKNITDLFLFRARSLHSFLYIIFLSWRIQTLQRAWNVWRLNSQISQDGTFVHYRFLYWTFFYLIYLLSLMGIFFPLFVCFDIRWQLATTLFYFIYLLSLIGIFFFPLFVCFDILWQLATTHATGTQIVRAKMTSLDAIFYRGNMSRSRSHARFCRRKHKKSTARASRSWKEFELDL